MPRSFLWSRIFVLRSRVNASEPEVRLMPETSVLTLDEGQQLLAEIQALRLRLEAVEKNLAMRVNDAGNARGSASVTGTWQSERVGSWTGGSGGERRAGGSCRHRRRHPRRRSSRVGPAGLDDAGGHLLQSSAGVG